MKKKHEIEVYTDGSCNLNDPNRVGGYGVVSIYDGVINEHYGGGQRGTTHNRMELLAVIVSLERLPTKYFTILIQSDSQYVVNSINKGWVDDWIKNNKPKLNMDLWNRFYKLYNDHGRDKFITIQWIKGHSGNKYNDLADKLALKGRLENS